MRQYWTVAKAISQVALIEQHLDQMPLTQAYLDAMTESIEDYRIRRVRWAAALLDRRGEDVVLWKVVRIARLSSSGVESIKAALEHEVYRFSAYR